MIREYSKKNSYGGKTYEIRFDISFPTYIYETGPNNYLVEFKENFIIFKKTHFSYNRQGNLREVMIETMNKVYLWFQNNKKYNWGIDKRDNVINNINRHFEIQKY
jgi:hypothetical protein